MHNEGYFSASQQKPPWRKPLNKQTLVHWRIKTCWIMQHVAGEMCAPAHNWFACLEVENEKPLLPSLPASLSCKATPNPIPIVWPQLQPWERCLLKCYVIATTPGPKSLTIKVEIQTTDTAEINLDLHLLTVEPPVNSWTGTMWNVTESALRSYNVPSQSSMSMELVMRQDQSWKL